MDDAQCAVAYAEDDFYKQYWDPESQVCAGFWDEGGVDSCNGDSGGPLIGHAQDGEAVVVGIVSWGNVECALPKNPGVYSQVGSFVDDLNVVLDAWSVR